jgi:hypothetical protein
MTDILSDLPEPEQEYEPAAPPGSVMAQLRAQREAIGRDTDTIIEVPGYNDMLGVKFQLPAFRRVNQLIGKAQAARGKGDAELNAATDILVEACEQVVVNDPGHPACLTDRDGEPLPWRPIDPEHGPTGFDQHLADLFGITPPSGARPRDIAKLVINRDFSLVELSNELMRWMGQANADANEAFQGE